MVESSVELTLYARRGCHLCEDMSAQLRDYASQLNFTLTEVDIDRDAALRQKFNVLVPVLYLNGREICHYFLDLVALKRALADFRASGHATG